MFCICAFYESKGTKDMQMLGTIIFFSGTPLIHVCMQALYSYCTSARKKKKKKKKKKRKKKKKIYRRVL